MILFINGFEITHWGKHEVTDRNRACYVGAAQTATRNVPTGALVGGYCLTKSFQENKKGNVYSPARDITVGAPFYQGQRMGYWDPVKNQIEKGFNDDRSFFINGSSDNRTTGQYRYSVGVDIGKKIIQNWEFIDNFQRKKSQLQDQRTQISNNAKISTFERNKQLRANNMSVRDLKDQLSKSDPHFTLKPNETIKLIGHSMGAAMVAGVAAVLAKHPLYGKKVEVVLYLAPHQPQHFTHPPQAQGWQSSSPEDLVASKNEVMVPLYNSMWPIIDAYKYVTGNKVQTPKVVYVPVSIEWAKGTTAYQMIRNVPQSNFIGNYTYGNSVKEKLSSQYGHSVFTYGDELDQFFKKFKRK
jgi:hypothetical protein